MTPDLQRGIHLIDQYDKPLGFKHTRQGLWICGQVLRTSTGVITSRSRLRCCATPMTAW